MRNFKFILAFLTYLCLTGNINSQAAKEKEHFNWDRVIEAIIQVESKGNPNAYNTNGDCCGVLQITKICVADVNRILNRKEYTLEDRKKKKKSKEMFRIIQATYNKENSIEKAIRIWNGGCGYSKAKTEAYYQKVMKVYNNGEL